MRLTLRLRKGAALGDAPDTFHLPRTLDGVLAVHGRGEGGQGVSQTHDYDSLHLHETIRRDHRARTQSGDEVQSRVPVSQSDASCIAEVRVSYQALVSAK